MRLEKTLPGISLFLDLAPADECKACGSKNEVLYFSPALNVIERNCGPCRAMWWIAVDCLPKGDAS